MSEWGTSASSEFAALMDSVFYKAAEATTDAADMVVDAGAQSPEGGAPPPEAAGPPNMSETLGQIADQEPDESKRQVIMEAAQRYSMMDSPPEALQAPPPQEAPPEAAGPPAEAPPPGAVPPPPDLGAEPGPPKTAAIRFADRVPANSVSGSAPKAFTTDNYLAFLHSSH